MVSNEPTGVNNFVFILNELICHWLSSLVQTKRNYESWFISIICILDPRALLFWAWQTARRALGNLGQALSLFVVGWNKESASDWSICDAVKFEGALRRSSRPIGNSMSVFYANHRSCTQSKNVHFSEVSQFENGFKSPEHFFLALFSNTKLFPMNKIQDVNTSYAPTVMDCYLTLWNSRP